MDGGDYKPDDAHAVNAFSEAANLECLTLFLAAATHV